MTTTVPPGVIADHVAAVNASDTEAIMTTFSTAAPRAGMKKWPRELRIPIMTAATQASSM